MIEKNNDDYRVPDETIEVIAKTMFKQARDYGFSNNDFIKYVNLILDLTFDKTKIYSPLSSRNEDHENFKNDIDSSQILINAPRISIKQYHEDQYELLSNWLSKDDGIKFLSTRIDTGEPADLRELLDSDKSMFGIVQLNDKPIGALAFLNIDRQQRKAELRKLIADPEARGQGFAKEATQYWIEFGIINLGLRKIYLHTLDKNLANIKINEKLGFRVEGILRDECYLNGKYHDLLRMALIIK